MISAGTLIDRFTVVYFVVDMLIHTDKGGEFYDNSLQAGSQSSQKLSDSSNMQQSYVENQYAHASPSVAWILRHRVPLHAPLLLHPLFELASLKHFASRIQEHFECSGEFLCN